MEFLESETREADDESGFQELNATYVWNSESFNVTADDLVALEQQLSSKGSGRNVVPTTTYTNTEKNRRQKNSTSISATPAATNNANNTAAAAVAVADTIIDAVAVRPSAVSGAVMDSLPPLPPSTSSSSANDQSRTQASTTITVVSSLLGKRNRDRSGVGRSVAFIDCLGVIERELQMQPAEVTLFDEGFIEFYKLYQDMVVRFEEMGTSDPPNAMNMAQRDAASASSASPPTTVSTTEVTTTSTTSHLHESLMKKRSALELEHKRLLQRSEMLFAAIAGIDEVLEVRSSSAYAQEGHMRNLLREMLLTEGLGFMSGYVKIRRELRK
jgi:hypothetical protein